MSWALKQVVTDYFGYLAQFFFICAALLFVFGVLSDFMPKQSPRWMRYETKWHEWRNRWIRKIKGMAQSAAVVWIFAISCLMVLILGAWMHRRGTVVQHNVVIYGQDLDGDWVMSSDEDPNLVFRVCKSDTESGLDVDGLLRSAINYVADYAQWEERGTCKSILRADLGFWFKDKHNNFTYRRIDR